MNAQRIVELISGITVLLKRYRLCIVTSALTTPALDICAFNLVSGAWAVEAGSIRSRVAIKERTAAQVTLT